MTSQALWPMGDTREDLAGLRKELGSKQSQEPGEDILGATKRALFDRDGPPSAAFEAPGAIGID
ncbi:hypothetical protein [uncultured Jannaschia sp.]|uniref:hypothetical protein n=1 Tax=uncultured Jannaschia sp. TaxID=293347 RepID=UPI002625442F|nr:hypothetical protein [uncultured Jannaschia sp.]